MPKQYASPEEWPHGTIGCYSNHKCRCSLCKRALADYKNARYKKLVEEFNPDADGIIHGLALTYNRGCRCQECRDAASKKQSEWRQGRKEKFDAEAEGVVHGFSAYIMGCKCDICKRAGANARLKTMYSMTVEDYETQVEERKGRCDICKEVPPTKLVVDHDHDTGKVRGLLCNKCNTALGKFGDSVEGLKAAIAYLESYADTVSL